MPDIPLPSPEAIHAVSRAAMVLALLLNLGSLPSARQIAERLGLERRTVSTYLRHLRKLGYIRPDPNRYGYLLAENLTPQQQSLLAFLAPPGSESPNLEQNAPVLLDALNNNNTLPPQEEDGEVLLLSRPQKKSPKQAKKRPPSAHQPKRAAQNRSKTVHSPPANQDQPPPGCNPELWLALGEARINGSKRRTLAVQPGLTPQAVRTWEMELRHLTGKRYAPGLLIHVLESGDPAPPTNARGHLLDCTCPDCSRTDYRRCIYCHKIPCECGMNPVVT